MFSGQETSLSYWSLIESSFLRRLQHKPEDEVVSVSSQGLKDNHIRQSPSGARFLTLDGYRAVIRPSRNHISASWLLASRHLVTRLLPCDPAAAQSCGWRACADKLISRITYFKDISADTRHPSFIYMLYSVLVGSLGLYHQAIAFLRDF